MRSSSLLAQEVGHVSSLYYSDEKRIWDWWGPKSIVLIVPSPQTRVCIIIHRRRAETPRHSIPRRRPPSKAGRRGRVGGAYISSIYREKKRLDVIAYLIYLLSYLSIQAGYSHSIVCKVRYSIIKPVSNQIIRWPYACFLTTTATLK